MYSILSLTTEAAPSWFNVIREGLENAIEHSGGYVSVGHVFKLIREGHWLLNVVVEDGEYVGFAIVEFLDTAKGEIMSIPFAYSSGGALKEFLDYACEEAYKAGLAGVKFTSGRRGFGKLAEQHGWDVGFVEYIVKDFTKGEK